MKKHALLAGAIGLCLMSATVAQASVTVTKAPDLGTYWHPLSGDGDTTYIYADSFVAPVSGKVSNIGLWLQNMSGDTSAQPIAFEVLGSSGGPNASDILATTGVLSLDVTGPLSLYSANTTSSFNLVAGQTYWVVGDERGLTSGGEMYVGGHTQNSGNIFDNGTFWYSNDPGGASFDGQNLTPEMAFTVTENGGVPEPATWALMLVGFGGIGAAMRTAARKATTA